MGDGRAPGSIGTTAKHAPSMTARSPLMPSPPPDGIGMDVGSAGGPASLADAHRRLRAQPDRRGVGNGQCFTLVDDALRNAGAGAPPTTATVTPDRRLHLGQAVTLAELRPATSFSFATISAACTSRSPDG